MEEVPASTYQNDPTNFKTGYLVKQGGRIKTWKKRMFVLDRKNKTLKYFKNAEDFVPKGIIHVEGYSVSDADDLIKKSFSFMITKEGFRTYYIVAEDLPTKNDWVEEIRATAKPTQKSPGAIIMPVEPMSGQVSDDGSDSEEDITLRRKNQPNEDQTLTKKPAPGGGGVVGGYGGGGDETMVKPKPQQQKPPQQQYQPSSKKEEATMFKPQDPNATLVVDFEDPNATLIGESHPRAADPNATLIGDSSGGDPNATLFGGKPDENATLVGEGGLGLVNNSAAIRAAASQSQTVVARIKLMPFNNFFPTIDRDVTRTLKLGRKRDDNNDPDFIGFDSKVVSRRHAEIWCVNGDFYIRDTRSQSGTFLNAMRLSLPGEESKPFKLKNGDTLQFGVDYRGSVDPTTKCVSMTLEVYFAKPSSPQPASSLPPLNMSDLTLVAGQN